MPEKRAFLSIDRALGLGFVVALHGAALWGLWQHPGVRHVLQFLVDFDADQVSAVARRDVDKSTSTDRLERAFQAVVEADRVVVPRLEQARADFGLRLDDPVDPVLAGDVEVVVNDVDGPLPDRLFIVARDENRIARRRPASKHARRSARLNSHTPGEGEQRQKRGQGNNRTHDRERKCDGEGRAQ